jgi:hypothetical protein
VKRCVVLALFVSLPCWAGRSFNGSTDLTTVPGVGNAIDLTGSAATWSCWFKMANLPGSGNTFSCMSKWNTGGTGGYTFTINDPATNQLQFYFYISIPLNHLQTVTCSTVLSANVWYNAVAVYANDADAEIYLNGSLCGTDLSVGSVGHLVSSGGSLLLGGTVQSAFCCNFSGLIAESAVWDVRLSPGQIQSLATVCPNAIGVPPVGYWPFWGASGSLIEPDLSGNVQSATLTGTSTADHPPCTP